MQGSHILPLALPSVSPTVHILIWGGILVTTDEPTLIDYY